MPGRQHLADPPQHGGGRSGSISTSCPAHCCALTSILWCFPSAWSRKGHHSLVAGGRACELCSWAFSHCFCQWCLRIQQSDSDMKNTDPLPAAAVLLAVLAAGCAVVLGVTARSAQTSAGTYPQETLSSENKAANLLQGVNDRACSVASVVQPYWCQDSPQISGNAGINLTLVLYLADGCNCWPHSRQQPPQLALLMAPVQNVYPVLIPALKMK